MTACGYLEEFGPQVRRFAATMRGRHGLTDREAVVLFYQCCGLTEYKRATRLLCCAEDTLKQHRTHTFRKLGVANCTGAVVRAWPVFVAATRGGP